MKHNYLKHLFTALLLLCGSIASAHDFEVDGIYYNITDATNNTVEVTYGGDSFNSYSDEYSGSEVIPETVTYNNITYSITSIGEYAFRSCEGLTSVTMGNSVTSIGSYAFCGCSGLKSVTMGNSVTSIGEYAFYGCNGLTSVTMGNSVTSIGSYAFCGCSGLTNITIPNSVTSIGDDAFSSCSGLINIVVDKENGVYDSRENSNAIIETATNTLIKGCKNTVIPNSVTSIGGSAFRGCSGLTSITIPNSVTSIGSSAFRGCSGLTSITIPNSVTSIGRAAFEGCFDLKELHIEDGTKTLSLDCQRKSGNTLSSGEGLFYDCPLETLYIGRNFEILIDPNYSAMSVDYSPFYNKYNKTTKLTSVTISNSVTSIGNYAFYGCSGLTSITIPNSVTSIGNDAFYGCSGLTSVTMGNSVTSIGNYAFCGCSGLTNITIPNSVKSIGSSAFRGCSGLTSVTMGNSVTSIGEYAFYGCTGLKTLINLSNLTLGSDSYKVYNAPNGFIERDYVLGKPDNVNTLVVYLGNEISLTLPTDYNGENYVIGDEAFKDNTSLINVTIPNSVTSIGSYAFYGCTGLTNITIPNSVTSIEQTAFCGCSGLTSITIPNSVTSIGRSAFNGCSGLTSVTIPNSVTNIGVLAFAHCSSIEELYIGSSIESIGDNAFAYCDKIKEIKIALERPFEASTDIFSSTVYDNAVLYIPNGTKSRYEKREPWNLFFDIIEMDFTGITLDKKTVALTEGNTTTLVAIVNLDGATDNDIIWTTSDSSVATVDNGVVTAVVPGTATITATVGGYSASCTVTVTASPTLSIVYHIYQPHHRHGATSWAVERGGNELKSNVDLGIELDSGDPRQQFAILSDDGGNTSFLYHVLEGKFICKDGSLSETPVDAIKFVDGAYSDTFFAYFDNSHYVNVGGERQMTIDSWSTPDGGNSCVLLPVDEFDPTEALEAIHDFTGIEEIKGEMRKEKGEIYDLRGRKLSEITAPGIYIIDGKKVLVK